MDLITIEELITAKDNIKLKRAPGPDGIPPEAVKLLAETRPRVLLRIFNQLVKKQEFPRVWKRAKVVLIWKGKVAVEAKSYRPISLISCIGKLYEAIIRNRMVKIIEERNLMSENQHGFRAGHSTIMAIEQVKNIVQKSRKKWIALTAIDIRNAFNTASWEVIMRALEDMGFPSYLTNLIDSYLDARTVIVGKEELHVNAGVPQGSVLGPTLWNVMYNGVLNLQIEGVTIIGFADDIGIVTEAEDRADLIYKTNEALATVSHWISRNQLTMAKEKTVSVILKGPRNRSVVYFEIQTVTTLEMILSTPSFIAVDGTNRG